MVMDIIKGTDGKFRIVCFENTDRIPGSTLVTATDDGQGFERNRDVTTDVGMCLDSQGRVLLQTGDPN